MVTQKGVLDIRLGQRRHEEQSPQATSWESRRGLNPDPAEQGAAASHISGSMFSRGANGCMLGLSTALTYNHTPQKAPRPPAKYIAHVAVLKCGAYMSSTCSGFPVPSCQVRSKSQGSGFVISLYLWPGQGAPPPPLVMFKATSPCRRSSERADMVSTM
eukprot:TRINITY_DN8774_c0_g1_i4.p4 TRINITY_DN8774_c0_g1~~TRINITY_DN8774_c0_g1_i4.p4  ORF type:complete len:159 (+),score=13.94 TRINITY_DN8774_c0_g1_i4:1272-1748(+)